MSDSQFGGVFLWGMMSAHKRMYRLPPSCWVRRHGAGTRLRDLGRRAQGRSDGTLYRGKRQCARGRRQARASPQMTGPATRALINIRPDWVKSTLTGEADGLSVFVRQARSDAAAFLANVGIRSGFAATLESYTFAANDVGAPSGGVRTQLGVVKPTRRRRVRLGGQAADGPPCKACECSGGHGALPDMPAVDFPMASQAGSPRPGSHVVPRQSPPLALSSPGISSTPWAALMKIAWRSPTTT